MEKKFIRGKKLRMSQIFDEKGNVIPVTLIKADSGETLKEGGKVKISGISKGKGFQGVVKRWGFKGRLSTSHGTKHELRTPGSVGSSMPDSIPKGRKMAGHMGAERVTVKNLRVVRVDKENNLLAVKGAVPGPNGALLEIRVS